MAGFARNGWQVYSGISGRFGPDYAFDSESEEEMRRIVMEIALLGRNGFQINDSSVRYTLNSLPGEFSGLQLLSYMYAGFQLIDPTADVGIDLTEEYLIATNLYSSEDIV